MEMLAVAIPGRLGFLFQTIWYRLIHIEVRY